MLTPIEPSAALASGIQVLEIEDDGTDVDSTPSTLSADESGAAKFRASSREHDDVLRELNVDPNYGLSPLMVEERQREYGCNELESEEEVRLASIVWCGYGVRTDLSVRGSAGIDRGQVLWSVQGPADHAADGVWTGQCAHGPHR